MKILLDTSVLVAAMGAPYQILVQSWLLEKLSQEAPDLIPHNGL